MRGCGQAGGAQASNRLAVGRAAKPSPRLDCRLGAAGRQQQAAAVENNHANRGRRIRKRTGFHLLSMAAMAAAIGLSVLTTTASTAAVGDGVAAAKAIANNDAFIVQMADMPVTAYSGGITGLAATKPGKGQKIDPNSPAVVAYMAYLKSQHDAALASVGGSTKLYSYGVVFNGFAAVLSDDQARKLAQAKGVVSVTRDEMRHAETSTTPTFLGLDAPAGLWARLGGTASAGDGIIIGVIDSGIWPESSSFTDRTGTNGNGTKDGKLSFH